MKTKVVDGIEFVRDYRSFWDKHGEAISVGIAVLFVFALAFAWGIAVNI